MRKEYFTIIVKGMHDIEYTDVNHLITLAPNEDINRAADFKYGYAGSGPNELAANIMWASEVDESECLAKASKFRDEVMHKKLTNDGRLYLSDIEAWLKDNNIKRSPYYYSTQTNNA